MNDKLAVVSPFDNLNYGNNLQRYAVQQLLVDRGYKPVSLEVRSHPFLGNIRFNIFGSKVDISRTKVFKSFAYTHGVVTQIFQPHKLINQIQEYFLGAVIGSDQIWNPLYGLGSRTDGLGCLNGLSGDKKIALCPSFGITSIPEEWAPRYAEWLNEFARLSVREYEGARIIRNLTGKDAEVLVDPTMAFGAERWREIADYSVCPDGDYVLTYYLGEDALAESVCRYVKERRMSVVPLMDKGSKWYLLPPDCFISLIDRAKLVITDSFHAAAFSLMMHTDFAIAQRKQDGMCEMLSRLNTLCVKFGCKDKIVSTNLDDVALKKMDWMAIDSKLRVEVARFAEYLDAELERLACHG